MLRQWKVGCLALASLCFAAQLPKAKIVSEPPYILLVSFDGFRHDYTALFDTPNLKMLAAGGAIAAALKPPFPPMTFTSHYTLVTGVRPEKHGIVDNAFFDPQTRELYQFAINAPEGKWYRRPPIWVTAAQQGIRTATYAWPGSEAEIDGIRPATWGKYTDKGTNDQQVDKAFEWFRRPAAERPRLVILYFNDVDTVGHYEGPDSPEMRAAVEELDRVVGRLQEGLRSTPLPINLIVVSDHGMKAVDGRIALRDYIDFAKVRVVPGSASMVHIYATDPQLSEQVYKDLKGKSSDFDVYRRAETPAEWRYSKDPRIGDLVVVATGSKILDARSPEAATRPLKVNKGAHGFDPFRFPAMNGIFVAAGPNIRSGIRLPAFDAIHIYPFLVKVLGIKPSPGIDGKASVLQSIYKK